MAVLSLLKTARLTQDAKLEEYSRKTLDTFSGNLNQFPSAFPQMMIALDFAVGPSREIEIEGDLKLPETAEMVREIYKKFIPNKVVKLRSGEGKPKVYVCRNYVCHTPVSDLAKLRDALE